MTTELEREGYIPPQKLIPTNKDTIQLFYDYNILIPLGEVDYMDHTTPLVSFSVPLYLFSQDPKPCELLSSSVLPVAFIVHTLTISLLSFFSIGVTPISTFVQSNQTL
ncbi:hypothetical protein PHAVU_001G125500 [Phaseolus vulgaris]|uniref:Uncharacterized protein n=1 Tax=Phaseolus vulgaris TaxID=3885 RepID=V7CVA6_PHAVU|nr:hypothetical protein PHAVU_001G125500g [Phaseolus vulgaris]ESW34112.1 hypothetical protein PHAVU_001G125500g [Phaseolus vulgaris]